MQRLGTDVSSFNSSGLSTSVNHTLLAGTLGNRKVVVRVGAENNGNITGASVTYGGVAMSLVTDGSQNAFAETGVSGFIAKSWVFQLDEASLPADGVHSVSVSLSGTPNSARVLCVASAFEDVVQGNAYDVSVLAEASPANDTMEATVSALSNSWVLALMMSGTEGDISWSTGNETTEVDATSCVLSVAELQDVSAGSYTPTASLNTTLQRGTFISIAFATAATPVLAVVDTLAVSDIESTTATANGEVTDDEGETIVSRGFVFGTSSEGDPGNVAPGDSDYDDFVDESGSFGEESFDLPLSDLTPSTTYYVRAFAEISAGFSYGDQVSFSTEAPPTYKISGTVTLDSEPVSGATVRCIRQSDNVAIEEQVTDESGEYEFLDLEESELYHLAVEYESEGQRYNAPSLWDVAPVEVEV